MKIAKQNNPANIDSLFSSGVEPAAKKDKRIHSVVPDDFDFIANDCSDVTLSYDIDVLVNYIDGVDYICQQRIIKKALEAKAGATISDKFNNCTNSEKDTVIHFNQMRGSQGGDENTAVATHLIGTGQTSAQEVGAKMRELHSDSVVRARPAVKSRIESSRMIQAIIKYLSPADTQQAMDTMDAFLRGYKDYVLIGSIIPDNEDGIYDYINSTSGFSSNGFIEEGWTPLTGTLIELRDILNDILFGDNIISV